MSPRNNGFFTGDKNGEIKFSKINFENEIKEIAIAGGHSGESVRDLGLSNSEFQLVSCHEDKNLRIWDLERFQQKSILEGHGSDVVTVDWHPTKSLIVSGGKDRLLKFWDPIANTNIGNLFNHTNSINSLSFNKNEKFLVSAGRD